MEVIKSVIINLHVISVNRYMQTKDQLMICAHLNPSCFLPGPVLLLGVALRSLFCLFVKPVQILFPPPTCPHSHLMIIALFDLNKAFFEKTFFSSRTAHVLYPSVFFSCPLQLWCPGAVLFSFSTRCHSRWQYDQYSLVPHSFEPSPGCDQSFFLKSSCGGESMMKGHKF